MLRSQRFLHMTTAFVRLDPRIAVRKIGRQYALETELAAVLWTINRMSRLTRIDEKLGSLVLSSQ